VSGPKARSRRFSAVKGLEKAFDGFFLGQEANNLAAFDLKWGLKPICGLDEAGRGPLAGPLVAAAVIVDLELDWAGVDDSKKLSPERREELYELIVTRAQAVASAVKSPQEVDRLNPLGASLAAMAEAFAALSLTPALALVDGNQKPALPCPAVATPHGDALSLSIAAASIVAKVTRDRLMLLEHAKYPQYGFDRHKGYGTREHLAALAEFGPCPIHRLTYRGVRPPSSTGGLF
jgi:ribonuclease HII